MKFNHNGNIHSIVEGIELYEMNNSNVTHELNESDDYFKFVVTGTDVATGMRSRFRFLLKANVKSAQRGSLDVVYLHRLIDETVRDILARENCFITGSDVLEENGKTVPAGGQFERAFNRHILSANAVVHRLPNERVIAFDGVSNAVDTTKLTKQEQNDLATVFKHQEGRQFIVIAGSVVYTYSCEDDVRWGIDEFKPAKIDGMCSDDTYVDILRHFVKVPGIGEFGLPLSIYSQDTDGKTTPIHSFKTREEVMAFITPNAIRVKKPMSVPPRMRSKQPVADREYQSALDANDRLMSSSPNTHRGPWKTMAGAVEKVQ